MYYAETVAAVARKLYRFSKKDVAEVLDVLIEVWQEELLQPDGTLHIKGFGRLHVEEQEVSTRGAVRQLLQAKGKVVPDRVKRYYFRFQPSEKFKQQIVAYRQQKEKEQHE